MQFTLKNTAVLAIAISQASGHVIMVEPHPYNLDTPPLLQTWPLSADLPFPCQGRFDHAEHVTTVTAGTTQTVKFWGSAVHGGGSCQFSIAYGDKPPSDPAAWHTIYSIIGGCPAEAEGNIPTDSSDPQGRANGPQCGNDSGKECTRQFNIPIPKDMKNGPAVFAWTWFNKIGNREMYMVCAPINVVGGMDNSDFVDSLPTVFQANIPGQCTTGNSGSVIGFPNPGKFGKVYQPIDAGSNGSCDLAGDPDFEDSDAKPVQPSAAPSQKPSPTPVTNIPSSIAAPSSSTLKSTPTPQAPKPTNGSVDKPVGVDGKVPCDTPGDFLCLDAGFFGICDHGWALPQPLAAGTSCVDGKIVPM